ncbi:hypothetical protein BESB_013890 [Besnoitia besnoiti]|uniref:Uncharacterized protein n=1 Tax=Besnoitia besnoiti TaxID=94643 RepID=A0A2A9MAX2_BESBE|nr:hypothetical protein BESB_013890 [Besnoitia besnoiti]PFH32777.1 hypothetical protein BESB_013890 [Besnoitia besnoiti]
MGATLGSLCSSTGVLLSSPGPFAPWCVQQSQRRESHERANQHYKVRSSGNEAAQHKGGDYASHSSSTLTNESMSGVTGGMPGHVRGRTKEPRGQQQWEKTVARGARTRARGTKAAPAEELEEERCKQRNPENQEAGRWSHRPPGNGTCAGLDLLPEMDFRHEGEQARMATNVPSYFVKDMLETRRMKKTAIVEIRPPHKFSSGQRTCKH